MYNREIWKQNDPLRRHARCPECPCLAVLFQPGQANHESVLMRVVWYGMGKIEITNEMGKEAQNQEEHQESEEPYPPRSRKADEDAPVAFQQQSRAQ